MSTRDSVTLTELFEELGPQLFRDGESDESSGSKGRLGLFTWRPRASRKESAPEEDDIKQQSTGLFGVLGRRGASDRAQSAAVPRAAGVAEGAVALVTRLAAQRERVVRVMALPGTPPPEVWSIDASGQVARWACKEKPSSVGTFSLAPAPAGQPSTATFACLPIGKLVWIAGPDAVELRDWRGKLQGKAAVAGVTAMVERCFKGSSGPASVWCGTDGGRLFLYYEDNLRESKATIRLTSEVAVNALLQPFNPDTFEYELWVSQGRQLSVVSETFGHLKDLSSSFEARVNFMRMQGSSSVWLACENGSIVQMDVQKRVAKRTVSVALVSCLSVALSGTRMWTAHADGSVHVLDTETGTELQVLGEAHDGAVATIAIVDLSSSGARWQLWTGGLDKTVTVWNAREDPPALALPVPQGQASIRFSDTESSVAASSSVGASSLSGTSPPPAQVRVQSARGANPETIVARPRRLSAGSGADLGASMGASAGSSGALPPALLRAASSAAMVSSSSVSSVGSASSGVADDSEDVDEDTSEQSLVSPRRMGSRPSVTSDGVDSSAKKGAKKRVMSKLLMAVQSGSVDRVRSALERAVAKRGDLPEAEALRRALDRRGPNQRAPLHFAAMAGAVDMIEVLLAAGADVAPKDKYELYPIHLCAKNEVARAALLKAHEAANVDPQLDKKIPTAALRSHSRSRSVAGSAGSRRQGVNKKASIDVPSAVVDAVLMGSRAGAELSSNAPVRSPSEPPLSPRHRRRLGASGKSVGSNPGSRSSSRRGSRQASPRAPTSPRGVATGAKVLTEEAAAVRLQSYHRMVSARKEAAELKRVREKRRNTVAEMVKTEETYVKTLDVLVNKIRVSMSTQSFRTTAGNISEADMKVIFPASLHMLLSAHQDWLKQLQERQAQWGPLTCVGDLFLLLSPYLKMYIVYVSNFELSTLKIRELKKRPNSTFAAMVQDVFVNLGDPTNDLASMLVTPVQRIPRYVMMLKDLLKNTSPQHPDYNNLLRAVKIMTDTTVLVDRKADDAKNAQKVLEVADSIVDSPLPIVQPNRKWVRDGALSLVVSATDCRVRHVFLFTDVLVLTQEVVPEPLTNRGKKGAVVVEAAPAQGKHFRYQREMSLLSATVQGIKEESSDGDFYGFAVRSPKTAFAFRASSLADKTQWMKAIESVIEIRREGNQSRINATTLRHKPSPSRAPNGVDLTAFASGSEALQQPPRTATPPTHVALSDEGRSEEHSADLSALAATVGVMSQSESAEEVPVELDENGKRVVVL